MQTKKPKTLTKTEKAFIEASKIQKAGGLMAACNRKRAHRAALKYAATLN